MGFNIKAKMAKNGFGQHTKLHNDTSFISIFIVSALSHLKVFVCVLDAICIALMQLHRIL